MTAALGSGVRPKRLIVYQLLGKPESYKLVRYKVEGGGRELESCFSSVAIADHYASQRGITDCEIRFFAPLSLSAPRTDSNGFLDLDAFRAEIDARIRRMERDMRWRTEVIPLPAFGSYRPKDGDQAVWTYNATPGSVAAAALVDMLRSTRLMRERDQEVSLVLNVSTGHNSYIPSLVEALRALLVLDSALSLGEVGVVGEAFYAAVDPMQQDQGSVTNVYLLETSARFFIDFPFKSEDAVKRECALNMLVRGTEQPMREQALAEEVFGRTRRVLIEGLKAFNAFRYGAPLALLDRRLIHLDPQEALECAQGISDLLMRALTPKVLERMVTVPDVDFGLLRSLLLSLALTSSISLKVSELGSIAPQEGVPLDVLKGFADLYDRMAELRINSRLLSRELQDLELVQSIAPTGWESLKAFYDLEDLKRRVKNVRYGSDEKRNFYAHAGLSRNEVEVRGEGGRLLLRYREERLKAIESWLRAPD